MYREAVLAPNISIIVSFFYPLFFFLSFNSISLLKLEHYCFFKKKPKTKQFPLLASLQDLKNVRKLAFAGIPEEAGLRARYWKVRNMSCLRHASIIIHHTALVVVCVLAVESRGRTTRAEESTWNLSTVSRGVYHRSATQGGWARSRKWHCVWLMLYDWRRWWWWWC